MATTSAAPTIGTLPHKHPGFRGLRLIPPLETYPTVLSFVQTTAGKLVLLSVFGIGLRFASPYWLPILLLLAVLTSFPHQRRILLSFGTVLWTFASSARRGPIGLIETAVILTIAGLLFSAGSRLTGSWFRRRPLVVLLGGFGVLTAMLGLLRAHLPYQTEVWSLLILFGTYIGFIGYSLLDINSKTGDDFTRQLGTYRPFWGSTATPIPKGAAYLRRIEAKGPEQLGIAQIKGVKLLAWAFVLMITLRAFTWLVHEYLGVPAFDTVLEWSVKRVPFAWSIAWLSLISAFFERMLELSVWGHQIVAICRVAGFMAPRNTYRPLESRSIAEFWNRYFYYYKELLVDFFFYPTFARYFKRWPRFRLFAATFAAAAIGNIILTFYSHQIVFVGELGLWDTLRGFSVYIVYSVLLAIGIGVSQLRKARPKPGWLQGKVVPAFCVLGFFCILHVFDYVDRTYPLYEHLRLFAHLFNFVS
jgi:hypothetical protein